MTLDDIIEQIETAIVANGTGAITAEVLNPILLGMVGQINDLTGELEDSNVAGATLVEMLNTLNEALGLIVSPTIYTGEAVPTFVLLPDASTGDYYLQTAGPAIIESYVNNGIEWVFLKNWIDDAGVSETTTWSSQKIKDYLDAVDKLISVGTIEVEAGFAIIPAGAYWRLGGVIYSNAAEVSVAIPAASAGMHRTDLLVANNLGGFDRVAGVESATYLSPPAPTAGTIAVAPVIVFGSEIAVTSPEVDAGEFVKKSFYNYIEFPGGGTDAIIPLDFKGRSEIRLVEDSLETLAGVDLSLIEGVDSAEYPYKGKLYILRNLTANPVTLLHASGAAAIPFASFDDVDLKIPVNGALIFSYGPIVCPVLFKNWDTKEPIEITGNTTLNNSHHGRLLWVTVDSEITLPAGLRFDFECVARTFTGISAEYLTSGGATIDDESDGTIQGEKSMSHIGQFTTDNYIISGGDLS